MTDEYDTWEQKCKAIREANAELLEGFKAWMAEKGLGAATIKKHVSNADFYFTPTAPLCMVCSCSAYCSLRSTKRAAICRPQCKSASKKPRIPRRSDEIGMVWCIRSPVLLPAYSEGVPVTCQHPIYRLFNRLRCPAHNPRTRFVHTTLSPRPQMPRRAHMTRTPRVSLRLRQSRCEHLISATDGQEIPSMP